jgi:hypothetical protein
MNTFISSDALDKLLSLSGAPRPVSLRAQESLRSHVNKATWQIFSRLLGIIRISIESSTIRPSHVFNLIRVVSMLNMPLRDDVTSRRNMKKDLSRIMQGGDPVMPGSYWQPGTDDTQYTAAGASDYTSLGDDSALIRSGIEATYTPGSSCRGGGDSVGFLTEAALSALLAEYRARITTSSMRLGKGTRTLITRIVSKNLVELLRKNGKKAIATTLQSWKLIF